LKQVTHEQIQAVEPIRKHAWADPVAGAVSVICAIHCILLPAILPVIAAVVGSVWIEAALMAMALGLGWWALSHGYKAHRLRWPAVLFLFGIGSLILGNWVLTGGEPLCCMRPSHDHPHPPLLMPTILVVLGGCLLVAAHASNFVLKKRAGCKH
jgi:hypothetical protein